MGAAEKNDNLDHRNEVQAAVTKQQTGSNRNFGVNKIIHPLKKHRDKEIPFFCFKIIFYVISYW